MSQFKNLSLVQNLSCLFLNKHQDLKLKDIMNNTKEESLNIYLYTYSLLMVCILKILQVDRSKHQSIYPSSLQNLNKIFYQDQLRNRDKSCNYHQMELFLVQDLCQNFIHYQYHHLLECCYLYCLNLQSYHLEFLYLYCLKNYHLEFSYLYCLYLKNYHLGQSYLHMLVLYIHYLCCHLVILILFFCLNHPN